MTNFVMPVSLYMSAPVFTVDEGATLNDVQHKLTIHDVSSVAVTGAGGRPVGVISRTDLLRVGRVGARALGKKALLTLPDMPIRDVMRATIVSVGKDDAIGDAARKMVDQHIHRVFVMEGDALVGVLSTKDVLAAIRDKRVTTPISSVMSAPVFIAYHQKVLATVKPGSRRRASSQSLSPCTSWFDWRQNITSPSSRKYQPLPTMP